VIVKFFIIIYIHSFKNRGRISGQMENYKKVQK